jgi:hypothetical protein
MSSTDTCVVRPELVEFQKYVNPDASLFLSLVAHPASEDENASFKFTTRSTTSANQADVTDLSYEPTDLADLYAQQLFVSNVETNTVSKVSALTMIGGTEAGTGIIDMSQGTITQVSSVQFYEEGASQTLNLTNDSIMFGAPGGNLDMTQGNLTNVKNLTMASGSVSEFSNGTVANIQSMTLTPDEGTINLNGGELLMGGGNINMADGSIINVTDLIVGDIRLHNTNELNNVNEGNSLVLEGVGFNDQNITQIKTATFVDNTSLLDMANGSMKNVSRLNMEVNGTGVIDLKDGNVDHVENLTFGANDASLTLVINKTGGAGGASSITNPNGSIDLEGILFNNNAVSNVNNVTFTAGGVLDLSDGTVDKVAALNMKSDGTGVLDVKDGDVKHVEKLTFGATDANLTLVINKTGGADGAPSITNPNGSIDLEGILFNNNAVSNVNNVTFTAGGVLDLSDGTLSDLQTLNMTANGTLNMNQSDILNLKDLTMTNMLTNGNVEIDGVTATIKHANGGTLTVEGTKMENQTMSDLTTLTFTTGGTASMSLSDGVVTDVLTQTMTTGGTLNMSTGTIDFGSAGSLEMLGTAQINIGAMNMASNVIKNVNEGGIVKVEDTEFNDTTVKTAQISKFDAAADVRVENTVFAGDNLTVTNVFTDKIESKTNDGPLDIKADIINLSKNNDSGAIRITNVATPIDDLDAANKKYVNEAVQENIQGLKPRKATDCSISGGLAGGAPSDFDKTVGNVFGNFNQYAIEFVKNDPDEFGNDACELKFHLEDTTAAITKIMFDGVGLDVSDLANITASGVDVPDLPKKRVLIMHLTEASINNATGYYTGAEFPNKYAHNHVELKGLNGIWEIESYADAGVTNWKTLTMKRALDMNESDEVLNGAYTYVKGGNTRANYGFVVTSKDPIKLGTVASGGNDYRGLTIDGTNGNLMQLEWIEFNNIDFELAFVNEAGTKKELLDPVVTFKKGGIAMKYAATDEKQVMVNAELLRYETGVDELGASNGQSLSLQINGNIDFNLANVDSYINSFGDETKVIVNNTVFERNGANANIYTTNITANTITAESDRNLKKNIAPMQDGIGLVSKLHPVNYQWKDENKSQLMEYGFIAQEVEEHFPSLVQTNPNTGIKSVDYPKVVSMLALAVQELTAKVEALTAAAAK